MNRTRPPVTPECADARPAHIVLREYGCTFCQRWHREGIDPLFDPHLMAQARNAYREIHVDDAIEAIGK